MLLFANLHDLEMQDFKSVLRSAIDAKAAKLYDMIANTEDGYDSRVDLLLMCPAGFKCIA